MPKDNIIVLSINSTYQNNLSEKELYEATNFAWEISEENRKYNRIKYAFAVYKNKIKEVYKINQWVPAIDRIPTTRQIDRNDPKIKKRFAFDGTIAYDIRDSIIDKKSFKRLYGATGYGSYKEAKEFYKFEEDELFNDIKEIININIPLSTEKENLVKCRIGQGDFRDKLIKYWAGCSVTKFKRIEILIASHIKPWRNSDNNERLDQFNGLLLTPNLDKLFDKGYISFDNDGKILISKKLTNYEILGINKNMKINIQKEHKKYLEFHRHNIYENI